MNSGLFNPQAVLFLHAASGVILQRKDSPLSKWSGGFLSATLLQDLSAWASACLSCHIPPSSCPGALPSGPAGLLPVPRSHRAPDLGRPLYFCYLERVPPASADPSYCLQLSPSMPPPQGGCSQLGHLKESSSLSTLCSTQPSPGPGCTEAAVSCFLSVLHGRGDSASFKAASPILGPTCGQRAPNWVAACPLPTATSAGSQCTQSSTAQ